MPTSVIECVNNMGQKEKNIHGLVFMNRAKDDIGGEPEKEFNLETTNEAMSKSKVKIKADLPRKEIEILEGVNNEMYEDEAYGDLNDLAEASANNADVGGDTMNNLPTSQNEENEAGMDDDNVCKIIQEKKDHL